MENKPQPKIKHVEKDESILKGLAVHDLEELKKYFLSKKKAKDVTGPPEYGYCDPVKAKENDQEKVALASYVRSGSTLSRSWFERITGIMTGSCASLGVMMNQWLEDMGFKGEAVNDGRVWLVKTHHPEQPHHKAIDCEKAILVVRNPLDAFPSGLCQLLTGTHDKRIIEEDYQNVLGDDFRLYCEQEIQVWQEFHLYYLKLQIPVHIIRFEDIIGEPLATFTEAMKFLLNKRSLEGTVMERILQICCGDKPPQMYVPRSGKVNANYQKYSPELLASMYQTASDMIDFFGYTELFTPEPVADATKRLREWNGRSLEKAIFNSEESDEIVSVKIGKMKEYIRPLYQQRPGWKGADEFKKRKNEVTVTDRSGIIWRAPAGK